MRKLKITGVLRAVFLVLTVTGILLFFLLTAMDRRKLQRTVDNTIAFARARIQRYEDFNTNDKVKSLIRLLDKSTELSRVIAAEGIPDQEKLDRYVEDQRLSGVLILDENMRVVLQNSQNGDTMPIWENQISGAYVRDILKHPEETYSTRLRNEGILYDFAAVARQDAPGLLITYIEKEEKEVRIDDFTQKSPLPFRVIMPQAFGCMKSILEYVLNTQDSIVLSLKDEGKDYLMELSIHTPYQVEFFGKACYMPQNPYIYDPTSIYKIWISKENDMPYRYRREMQHSISEDICSDFVYNPSGKGKIVAEDYYPADYVRRIKGEKSQKATVDMTGKKAPDWTLTDMKGQKVSLSGIKSKVILLQFTGIGCGPCKISIPFLNSLRKEYAVNELEVLAVETWGRSKSSCEAYVKNQGIEYSFLTADKDTIAKLINDYQAGSGVPQFYLIGKDRTIIAKLQGYAEKTTDTEIEKKIKANL